MEMRKKLNYQEVYEDHKIYRTNDVAKKYGITATSVCRISKKIRESLEAEAKAKQE